MITFTNIISLTIHISVWLFSDCISAQSRNQRGGWGGRETHRGRK